MGGTCFPLDLMAAIPEQQLEEFWWEFSRIGSLQGSPATTMFLRHSRTLRKVVFDMLSKASRDALCAVLFVCEALEEFSVLDFSEVKRAQHNPLVYINLDGAVARSWVCTKLRHLQIVFAIIRLPLEPAQKPYYKKMPKVALSDQEQEQFSTLERLYREVGRLTELSFLDLEILPLNDQGRPTDTPRRRGTFPALLSLGDLNAGRPGYLDCLGGLTKLREL
ncbi:hypothetical protein BGX33_008328 [Mortierella sp. NVP41]|nr:hypothetical protein BGX33_008328 [Mortierella sp. NVP41]